MGNLEYGLEPHAEPNFFESTTHGDRRTDAYHWLRDRSNPKVMDYLNAENLYTETVLKREKKFQEQLFEELKGRIQEEDQSVPVKDGNYYYYNRVETGAQYPIYCRKEGNLEASEQVLLDCNQIAATLPYFSLGIFRVSPDHTQLAYAIDTDGSEKYTLKFKDLTTGADYSEVITGVAYSLEWANDNKTVFYTVLDANQRPDRLLRHTLGTPPAQDTEVYREIDPQLFVYCEKSKSERFIFLQLYGKVTSEYHILDANRPAAGFKVFKLRARGVLYSLEHREDQFLILTNEKIQNFAICTTPIDDWRPESWSELVSGDAQVYIEGLDSFKNYLVVKERAEGLGYFKVYDWQKRTFKKIEFPEPCYQVSDSRNPEYESPYFRYVYTSMITPTTTIDFELATEKKLTRKVQQIPSGYDPSAYASERIFATAPDGTRVPISLVYRRDMFKGDGSNLLYLYGYGAYGSSMPASFSTTRLSLLNRGFVYAIAHVRGGTELGRNWYEDGKFLKKHNTFNDFIACAEKLISAGYTYKGGVAIAGGSAGGMLIGAVLNARPELFLAAIAQVPFVDVLNTMLDTSLPLTTLEFEEWGNPGADAQYYHYIKSYSPYDNVKAQKYPHLLITGGLNDPRVTYWEPAKWCARLRELKTDQNLLCMHINMEAGHGGRSGRFEALKEYALEFTFLLKVAQRLIPEKKP